MGGGFLLATSLHGQDDGLVIRVSLCDAPRKYATGRLLTDVQQNCAVVLLVDCVVAQHLVVEGLRGRDGAGHGDGFLP